MRRLRTSSWERADKGNKTRPHIPFESVNSCASLSGRANGSGRGSRETGWNRIESIAAAVEAD